MREEHITMLQSIPYLPGAFFKRGADMSKVSWSNGGSTELGNVREISWTVCQVNEYQAAYRFILLIHHLRQRLEGIKHCERVQCVIE